MNAWARHYYQDIARYIRNTVAPGGRVLEVGARHPLYVEAADPGDAAFVPCNPEVGKEIVACYPRARLLVGVKDAARETVTFDTIIVSDTIGKVPDAQEFLADLQPLCNPHTRLVIANFSRAWQPLHRLAEWLGMKLREPEQSWLGRQDLLTIMPLAGFEPVRCVCRMLCPLGIPLLAPLLNRVVTHLPFVRRLGFYNVITARPVRLDRLASPSLSLVVPARNESGNIERLFERLPALPGKVELILVEGGSSDDTWDAIQVAAKKHAHEYPIVALQQSGKGKANAVHEGLAHATGDLVGILDADLTMPPEELPKFYLPLASGYADFANGSRLVYPQENQAMRSCNLFGNHLFALVFSWLLGQRVKDTLCGTKMLFRSDYQHIRDHSVRTGLADPFGDFELLLGAARLRLKITDIPVHYGARQYGDTNIRRWHHGLQLLKMTVLAARAKLF